MNASAGRLFAVKATLHFWTARADAGPGPAPPILSGRVDDDRASNVSRAEVIER
jgi:hypothetical protein